MLILARRDINVVCPQKHETIQKWEENNEVEKLLYLHHREGERRNKVKWVEISL